MTCRDCQPEWSAYLDGEVSSARRAALERHLADCPDCRAELEVLRQVAGGVRALPRIQPPAGFLAEVRRKLDAAEDRSWISRLFVPVWPKVPLEALAAMVLLFGLVILVTPRHRPAHTSSSEPAAIAVLEKARSTQVPVDDHPALEREQPDRAAAGNRARALSHSDPLAAEMAALSPAPEPPVAVMTFVVAGRDPAGARALLDQATRVVNGELVAWNTAGPVARVTLPADQVNRFQQHMVRLVEDRPVLAAPQASAVDIDSVPRVGNEITDAGQADRELGARTDLARQLVSAEAAAKHGPSSAGQQPAVTNLLLEIRFRLTAQSADAVTGIEPAEAE